MHKRNSGKLVNIIIKAAVIEKNLFFAGARSELKQGSVVCNFPQDGQVTEIKFFNLSPFGVFLEQRRISSFSFHFINRKNISV